MDPAPVSNKPLAVMEPEEYLRLQRITETLNRQLEIAQRARTAFEQSQIIVQALENERNRAWRDICEAHQLVPETDYSVDPGGRIYAHSDRRE